MRKLTLSAVAVGLLAAGAIAQADQIRLNPSASWYFNDAKRNLQDSDAYQLGLEYVSDHGWGVEASAMTSHPDQQSNATGPDFMSIPGLTQDPDMVNVRIDGLYYFGQAGSRLTPYVAVGIGEARWDYDTADHAETQINVGGGVRYQVARNVTVNADARVFRGLDDDTMDETLSLGVAYAFDLSAPKAAPAPAPAPVVVPAPVKAPEPVAAPVKMTVETIKLNVQFPTASYVVAPRYLPEIQKVADFLKKYPDTSVVIEGHTDNVGKDAANLKLSNNRAAAVSEVLVKKMGIDAKRVSSVGFGRTKPVASNDNPAGRQENRRVMAVLQKEVPAQQ